MSGSEDTEITIGTGKMLALFFGLVVLCAVFFGMGFKMGKSYATPLPPAGEPLPTATTNSGERPSAVKPSGDTNSNPSPDTALYKSASPSTSSTSSGRATPSPTPASTAPASDGQAPTDPSLAPPQDGYYVQVAAVTKQEDAQALVDALKKKQYPAFAAAGPDKLYHVQVGPFADVKNAEDMRAKLVNDGYNPILKR
jgi:DedD protein